MKGGGEAQLETTTIGSYLARLVREDLEVRARAWARSLTQDSGSGSQVFLAGGAFQRNKTSGYMFSCM